MRQQHGGRVPGWPTASRIPGMAMMRPRRISPIRNDRRGAGTAGGPRAALVRARGGGWGMACITPDVGFAVVERFHGGMVARPLASAHCAARRLAMRSTHGLEVAKPRSALRLAGEQVHELPDGLRDPAPLPGDLQVPGGRRLAQHPKGDTRHPHLFHETGQQRDRILRDHER